MSNSLERLRRHSVVVADTGDFQQMAQFAPRDATTNPSLILKAVQQPAYAMLLRETLADCGARAALPEIVDALLVRFGIEILRIVPGRVSTEVDARLSFDRAASVRRARRIVARYANAGIGSDRVLIKLASTWEGLQAARDLESEGIHCNLTLLFAFVQARAAADARVTLISPFVGRILDWHKAKAGAAWDDAAARGAADPGVQSVRRIHGHYKRHGIQTEVMGASFRNVDQILALAGCDLLTISPELLAQLQGLQREVPQVLGTEVTGGAEADAHAAAEATPVGEADFRFALNEDEMASTKLAEGIRAFAADACKLDQLIEEGR